LAKLPHIFGSSRSRPDSETQNMKLLDRLSIMVGYEQVPGFPSQQSPHK
jgi:hypothetical protein